MIIALVIGTLLAALAVALSAYAAHAVDAAARPTLQMAAMFAFGHGVALAALAIPVAAYRLGLLALAMLLLGTLLFAGGLVHGQWTGLPARTAPFGGSALIFGWLVYAVHAAQAVIRSVHCRIVRRNTGKLPMSLRPSAVTSSLASTVPRPGHQLTGPSAK